MTVFALLAASMMPAPSAVPMVYTNRLVFVSMTVNGQADRLFLLDTGANKSAIEEKLVQEQGLKPLGKTTVEGTAGTAQVGHVKLDRLELAGVEVKDLDVTMQSLGGIAGPPGRRVDGILGTDFLKDYAVRIDYRKQEITLFPKSPKRSGTTSFLPFRMDNQIPRMKARLNDAVDAEFRLDTGASLFETEDVYVNIPTGVWEEMTKLDPELKPQKYFTGSGVGGEVKLAVSQLDRMTIGSIEVSQPYVIVQPKAGYFARPDAAGFVSNNLLEKYGLVTLDFLARRIYLGA